MSVLIILAALSSAPAAPARTVAKPICQDDRMRSVEVRRSTGPHKLSEEPNADAVLTVLRTVDGCSRPVKVRENLGGR